MCQSAKRQCESASEALCAKSVFFFREGLRVAALFAHGRRKMGSRKKHLTAEADLVGGKRPQL